jgi:hypothetical protein
MHAEDPLPNCAERPINPGFLRMNTYFLSHDEVLLSEKEAGPDKSKKVFTTL